MDRPADRSLPYGRCDVATMMTNLAAAISGRLVVLAVASVIVFALLNLLPGDPATVMLGLDASPDSIPALHHQLGLHASPTTRYPR